MLNLMWFELQILKKLEKIYERFYAGIFFSGKTLKFKFQYDTKALYMVKV